MSFLENRLDILKRLLFLLLSTAIMVFFSEKAYWYPSGYPFGELVLFYAFPVFACMWAIDYFKVNQFASLVLIAAGFAFLTEGVITPVMFEGGLFDPIMPAYFIGWHGLLGLIFGWYFIRKWLTQGAWIKLLAASTLFGLFWGFWSITYWLPENVAEWMALAAAGEPSVGDPRIPAAEFGLYALTFTLVLGGAHWCLGRFAWQPSFVPSKAEKWTVGLGLLWMFLTLSVPGAPLGFLKLFPLLLLIVWLLQKNKASDESGSLLQNLEGGASVWHLLTLLAMPATATAVYAIAQSAGMSDDVIRPLLEDIPVAQGAIGFGLFVWAIGYSLWPRSNQKGTLVSAINDN